jgi:gliding motility-associated-like protein/uncharacterized repeat protein (TIGR01451 family)
MKQFYQVFLTWCVTCFLLLPAFSVYADGSKNLYPNAVRGQRSFLMSSSNTTTDGWPFMQVATQYVYAKTGETVAAASSAQGVGAGIIRLIAPDGTTYESTAGDLLNGRIVNRTQELAGPNVGTTTTGYIPFTRLVSATQVGIWTVELLPSRNVAPNFLISAAGVSGNANENWSGQNNNSHAIRAWDISVISADGVTLIPGRTYATVMNMYNSGGYYSSAYVLTNDGYVYQVNNNGMTGLGFAYFVNNKGITDGTDDTAKPIYKSVAAPNNIKLNIKDPRDPDGDATVTHKMFYTFPDPNMPGSATYFGGTTWLRVPKVIPTVSGITVQGVEGTSGQVSRKGATIKFKANMAGVYRVSLTGQAPFVTREITGSAVAGDNTVLWDGKDGAGALATPGSSVITVKVTLQGAEVHFPFLDVENNVQGIIIEQLNNDGSKKTGGDIVYWDDSDFPDIATASKPRFNGNSGSGISSNTNGHIWGNLYGDVRAMDTWTYILGDATTQATTIQVKVADLEVVSIAPSASITKLRAGQNITYNVLVRNNGPSDVTGAPFKFKVPAGFTIANTAAVTFVTSCGTVNSPQLDASGNYTALLNLPNGCTANFSITGTAGPALTCGNINVEASIMRPKDVTDPDATNPDPLVLPTDPHLECLNGTATESCNNIKYNAAVTVTPLPPVSGGDQAACQSNPIQTLTATATPPTGYSVIWYDAAIGGNVVASPILNAAGTKTYYAETTNGTCISAIRTPVKLTINATPIVVISNPPTVCAGSTIAITAPSITQGSDAGLTYTYFTDAAATIPLATPAAVAQSGTYYIKATNVAGCTTILPVKVLIITVPGVTTVQPTCITITGSITVNSPLGAGIEYSIDGTNYQSATLFDNLLPGTYNVTARNQAIGCISPPKTVTINPSPTTLTPVVLQPDCDVTTGTITFPSDARYQYSIDNGGTFVANNVFSNLVPNTYSVRMKLIATSCVGDPVDVVIVPHNIRPAAPVSGGDQIVCATIPIQTLTATASINAGEILTWYDASTNGNVVSNPTLSTTGTRVYYAETSNSTCSSLSRTPVMLAITASPVINTITDQSSCGPLTLPQITGSNLSGNQAYYTAINKGGTKYNPGEVFSTAGLTTLYAYDEAPAVANPADLGTRLTLSLNATYNTGTKLTDLLSSTDYGYVSVPAVFPSFTIWQGGSTSFIIPRATGKTYGVFTGQTSLPNAQSITGDVFVSMGISLTPQNAAETGNTGRISIINTATNKILYETQLGDVGRRATITPKVEGIVSAADLQAGNIGILVALKSTGTNLWTATQLIVTYKSVLPNCPAIQSMKVTINVIPTAPVSGGDQTVCATDPVQTLTATATTDADNTITWYDAEIAGNIVATPTLTTVGTKTYYAEASNGNCTSLTRTAVILTINPVPIAIAGTAQIQYNNAVFTLGATPVAGGSTGSWTVVSGTPAITISDINDPNATISLTPNTSVTLRWTVTTGSCAATDDVTLTYTLSADVVTVKTLKDPAQTTFKPGQAVVYTIKVTNNGPSDASSVNIKDSAPTGTTITGWTAVVTSGTVTLANTNGTTDLNETIATLPNGAIVTYEVTVQTPASFTGTLSNTSSETSTTSDPDPTCVNCTAPPVTASPSADVVTVKTLKDPAQTTFIPGQAVVYKIAVTNNGPSDASNVSIKDAAPAGTTITGWTAAVTNGTVTLANTNGTSDLDETIATLPNGAIVTYEVTVQTPASFTGTLSNTVTETSTTTDPDPTCVNCTAPPVTASPSADVVTVKTLKDPAQTTFIPGQAVVYTIKVTNNGPSDARNVNIKDAAPTGTTITKWTVAVASGTVTLANTNGTTDLNETIATLPNGAVVTYEVTVQTPASFTGTLSNTSSETSTTSDPDPTCVNCTAPPVTASPSADVVTVKTLKDPAQTTFIPGQAVVYTIKVTNNGPSDARNVNIKDAAPSGTTITKWTVAVASGTVTLANTSGTTDLNETITTLPNGAVVTYEVTVQTPANFTKTLSNAVLVSSITPDPDPTCAACITTPISPFINGQLKLWKSGIYQDKNGDGKVNIGDIIRYTFGVQNTGNVPISNILISDPKVSITGGPVASLAPGVTDETTFSAIYTITQADIDKSAVYNLATAKGKDPAGQEIAVESKDPNPPSIPADPACISCTITPLPSNGEVALVKTVTNTGTGTNGVFRQGDEIQYQFVVTNTGSLTLNNMVIKDPMISNQDIKISGILLPGTSITYTATYKVTTADAVKGQVSNQALVTTTDANGKPVIDQSGTELTNDAATLATVENIFPIATDDTGSTNSGKPLAISLIDNDQGGSAPLDPSTIEIVGKPAHGTVTVNADGTIIYTSDKGYTGTDSFTYRIKDVNGNWSNVASVTITLNKALITIPTLFTPNGDGINDTFEIRGLNLFYQNDLIIINRWGNEVYKKTNYKNDWTGQGLNEGTYFYLLRVRENSGAEWQVFKGYITLIRTFKK